MELLTQVIKNALPKLYSQESATDPLCVVKLFMPEGRMTYYIIEGTENTYQDEDGNEFQDWRLFGYIVSPLGADCDELGYVMLSELEALRGPMLGLPMERDLYWTPAPLSKVKSGEA